MPSQSSGRRVRVFLSYKRNVEPDQSVANQVVRALGQQHDIFMDQHILVGLDWGRWIQKCIRESDFLVTFLTSHSVNSEMVIDEVRQAHELSLQAGVPRILPVRLAYEDSFHYPLSAYLNHIQWAWWRGAADTERLIAELQQAIATQSPFNAVPIRIEERQQKTQPPDFAAPTPAAQPKRLDAAKFDSPEGTIDPQSAFYVARPSDSVALDAIQRQGVTVTIKGPRQMGKSSLLIRTLDAAVKAGKRAIFLDYQLIERGTLTSADRFYRRFCDWVTDDLELENRIEEFWNSPLGNSQRCTRYFGRHVLKEVNGPLVIAMDEVENLFDTDFRSDFFSMLRSWHNSRANVATPIWKNLDLVLVTSTEPYQLIENLNQSPFNVGEVINLEDFTVEEIADLNERHGALLNDTELQRLRHMLGGHPYLTRRALYLIATGRMSVEDLFARATDDRGPFGDHLRYHLFRLTDKEDLVRALCDALTSHTCNDERLFFRLSGAGLVKRVGHKVQPRCQLYSDFFLEHLQCRRT